MFVRLQDDAEPQTTCVTVPRRNHRALADVCTSERCPAEAPAGEHVTSDVDDIIITGSMEWWKKQEAE